MPSWRRLRPKRPEARGPFFAHTGRYAGPPPEGGPDDSLVRRCLRLTTILGSLDQGIALSALRAGAEITTATCSSRPGTRAISGEMTRLAWKRKITWPAFLKLFRRGVAHAPVVVQPRLGVGCHGQMQPVRELTFSQA
jgi:hypothetical protein